MSKFIAPNGATIDSVTEGFAVAGDYLLVTTDGLLNTSRPVALGAYVKTAGHTATIQFFGKVAGLKKNIDSALTPDNGTPVIWPNEYTLTGVRGITISSLTGTVYVEVGQ